MSLRNSLNDAVLKLKTKNESTKPKRKKIKKGRQAHMWIPKVAQNIDQSKEPPNIETKLHRISKFSATNPPKPTPKWVPKTKI